MQIQNYGNFANLEIIILLLPVLLFANYSVKTFTIENLIIDVNEYAAIE